MTTRIALHESGHAIAAYVLGVPIRSVGVKPKETHLGRCEFNAIGFESDLEPGALIASRSPR